MYTLAGECFLVFGKNHFKNEKKRQFNIKMLAFILGKCEKLTKSVIRGNIWPSTFNSKTISLLLLLQSIFIKIYIKAIYQFIKRALSWPVQLKGHKNGITD